MPVLSSQRDQPQSQWDFFESITHLIPDNLSFHQFQSARRWLRTHNSWSVLRWTSWLVQSSIKSHKSPCQLLIPWSAVENSKENGRTQMAHEAIKVIGKVYGSSGVGWNRKKGYSSGCQDKLQFPLIAQNKRKLWSYGSWGQSGVSITILHFLSSVSLKRVADKKDDLPKNPTIVTFCARPLQ